MQLIDPNHPAYQRLWVRIAIVAVCFGWAGVELVTGDPFWAVLAGGAGAYSFYMLFLTFKPKPPVAAAAAEADAAEESDAEETSAEKPSKDEQAE
ncbi:hypothetical protein RJJ65_12540 [Rhizobium hidalgonense]|uniref:DUF3329 domain-containing protein n=1 Tax=Rhizobium hidalgonense TaxID=1538159 RepID=A0AAJ2LJP7_9HYPH|nr:hypothetical protein [Rhizobium hidalgonense]MDR9773477.1 hypothetical protein [Rhizobium hidalgonense]MDR9819503.1 hypothetical protein [Rhizobium hidalgonense]